MQFNYTVLTLLELEVLQLARTQRWVQNVVIQSFPPRAEIIHQLFEHAWW